MRKRFLLGTLLCSLLVLCFSCKGEEDMETTATGKISGKVAFSNMEETQNGGIMVTLDKTDGLNTVAVTQAMISRSVVDAARMVVSTGITQFDGSYVFTGLEAGTYTVYAASSYSAERAVCTNVVVRSAETTVAETLKLTATGTITGTITTDEATTGNLGYLVFVAGTSYMVMTDDSGSYTISGVPAGSGYQIVASKNGVIHSLRSDVTVNANGTTIMPDNNFTSEELEIGVKGDAGKDGKDGVDGKNGIDGKNGVSMVWLGSFASSAEIENPEYLNAFFNTTDGCSYIYDGTEWTLLARSGMNGANGEKGADGKDGEAGANGSGSGSGTTQDSFSIATVLSTESLTNDDVTITVSLTKSDMAKVGYVYTASAPGFANAKEVLNSADFVTLTKNASGKYVITATVNGWYTIAAKDTDGFTAFSEETITNIDKTAPGAVTGLSASYSKNTKKITVSWVNPTDSDFDYVSLSYTKAGTAVSSNVQVEDGMYTVSDVEIDGSDNWAYICSVDPAGTADAATNYPAFNYANNYATTFGLTGEYADGWYMPSIAELCYIYRSKAVLNAVLNALERIQLYSNYYWSSSQYGGSKNAWDVYFGDGGVDINGKHNNKYVCCVRAFN